MPSSQLFISYSRKDKDSVEELYSKLVEIDACPWMDSRNLLPGQNWEREIAQAIRNSAAVVICLSSSWVTERGYVHAELRMALEAMRRIPEGQIFIIPVRLDECEVPESLESLHWVDLFESDGFELLRRSVERLATGEGDDAIQTKDIPDLIEGIRVIRRDPWSEAANRSESDFKRLLKGRWEESMDYLEASRWQAIVDLWEPMLRNEYFRVDHPNWSDKPFFRTQIHSGNSHLFMAYVQLGQTNEFQDYVPKAYSVLKEVVKETPYSMAGARFDRLEASHARIQNENYLHTVQFASDWFRHWSASTLTLLFEVDKEEAEALQWAVTERIADLRACLATDEM